MMKIVLYILIQFPSLSFPAPTPVATSSADDCTFNFAEFHSTLDHDSPKFKFVSVEKKDDIKKHLSQTAELKSGEKIEYSGGGCAHVGVSFSYSDFKVKHRTPQHQALKAFQLLEATPVTRNDLAKNILATSLRKFLKGPIERKANHIYELPCGDALCQLNLSVENKLTVSYSFAL